MTDDPDDVEKTILITPVHRHLPPCPHPGIGGHGCKENRGFTLIEVLIVVAIIGLLAAIAVPSYTGYLTKARRGDATILLTEAAGEQFRHFSEFNAYTADLTELGYGLAGTVPSPDGHYTMSAAVDAGDPTRFVLTATPVPGGSQANDADCGSFSLNDNGVRSTSGGGENCW